MYLRLPILCLIFLMNVSPLHSQKSPPDSTITNNARRNMVIGGLTVTYAVTLVALNEVWYKELGQTSFHFFNDNGQWNGIDKAGHFYSAYQLSNVGKEFFVWARMPEKKAAIYGSVMSQAFLIPMEVMDGFAVEYGFSWGDIIADVAGAGLFLAQDLGWKEQRIKPKFSFHQSEYAAMRPEVLGESPMQQLIKDYNGQTYWLSFDIYAFTGHSWFPKWLNIAAGYGAEEMLYGSEADNQAAGYESYRQYYLGIDLDLSHIKTKNKLLKGAIFFVDMIKLPAPALEFNSRQGFVYHWLYF